jgi:hypothetical protein
MTDGFSVAERVSSDPSAIESLLAGSDIPSCLCPHCQSGPPGLPTSAILG